MVAAGGNMSASKTRQNRIRIIRAVSPWVFLGSAALMTLLIAAEFGRDDDGSPSSICATRHPWSWPLCGDDPNAEISIEALLLGLVVLCALWARVSVLQEFDRVLPHTRPEWVTGILMGGCGTMLSLLLFPVSTVVEWICVGLLFLFSLHAAPMLTRARSRETSSPASSISPPVAAEPNESSIPPGSPSPFDAAAGPAKKTQPSTSPRALGTRHSRSFENAVLLVAAASFVALALSPRTKP